MGVYYRSLTAALATRAAVRLLVLVLRFPLAGWGVCAESGVVCDSDWVVYHPGFALLRLGGVGWIVDDDVLRGVEGCCWGWCSWLFVGTGVGPALRSSARGDNVSRLSLPRRRRHARWNGPAVVV